MSAFHSEGLDDRTVKKTSEDTGVVNWNYVFLFVIALLFAGYFFLWGYLIIEGSKVLSTLPNSETTTLYGP
jgi:hypothetical protein